MCIYQYTKSVGHAVRGVGFGSRDHGFGPCLSLWFNQIYCLILRFFKTCERIFLSYEKRKLNKLKKKYTKRSCFNICAKLLNEFYSILLQNHIWCMEKKNAKKGKEFEVD